MSRFRSGRGSVLFLQAEPLPASSRRLRAALLGEPLRLCLSGAFAPCLSDPPRRIQGDLTVGLPAPREPLELRLVWHFDFILFVGELFSATVFYCPGFWLLFPPTELALVVLSYHNPEVRRL